MYTTLLTVYLLNKRARIHTLIHVVYRDYMLRSVLSVNRLIKYATVNSGREGRICERPKMIGWSLSQAGAPEMGMNLGRGSRFLLHARNSFNPFRQSNSPT